jgi:hypothetical protein
LTPTSRTTSGAFRMAFCAPRKKAPLCNPCLRNELSPLSQEGHTFRPRT